MIKYTFLALMITFQTVLFAKNIPIRHIGPEKTNVTDFCVTSDGSAVFAAYDNYIGIYRLTSGKMVKTIQYSDSSQIQSLALSTDSTFLISGLRDGVLVIHDLRKNSYRTVKCSNTMITSVNINASSYLIALGTEDGETMVLDTSGKVLKKLNLHKNIVTKVILASRGNVLISSGMDGKIYLTDLSTGQSTFCQGPKHAPCYDISVNLENNRILASYANGKVLMWIVRSDNSFVPADKYSMGGWATGVSYYFDKKTWCACTSLGHIRIYTSISVYNCKLRGKTLNQIKFVYLPDDRLLVMVNGFKNGLNLIYAADMKLNS